MNVKRQHLLPEQGQKVIELQRVLSAFSILKIKLGQRKYIIIYEDISEMGYFGHSCKKKTLKWCVAYVEWHG